jgi:hypothetical protein
MTKLQIHQQLSEAGKPIKSAQLDRYLRRFKIKPQGVRLRPQQFPADSTRRILLGLGWQDIQAGKTAQVNIPPIGNGPGRFSLVNHHRQPGKAIKAGHTLNGKRRAVTTNTRSHLTPALTASRSIASMNQLRAVRAKARGAK